MEMSPVETLRGARRTLGLPARLLALVFGVALVLVSGAAAQVTPSIVFTPWSDKPHRVDSFDDILLFGKTQTGQAGEDARILYWDSGSRIKVHKNDSRPRFGIIGYRALSLYTASDNSVLNGQLNDIALVTGGRIGGIGAGWTMDLLGGVGTANDGHFGNGDSWYGLGSLGATRQCTPGRSLSAGIAFDGNRSLWPGAPLPYVSYRAALSERCVIALGVPESSVWMRALGDLTIDVSYSFPVNVDAVAEYEVIDGVRLFALDSRRLQGFYQDAGNRRSLDIGRNQRLFHELDRVGTGIRWITRWFDASLGVGYAFNHRFRSGHDLRDLDTYRDVEDEWLLSLRARGTL